MPAGHSNCLPLFILVGLFIVGTNGRVDKILSQDLIEECKRDVGDGNSIQNCLKNEIEEFCHNIDNGTDHEIEQLFCNTMHKRCGKAIRRREKGKIRMFGPIPLMVREQCRKTEEDGDEDDVEDCIQEELKNFCAEYDDSGVIEEKPAVCKCSGERGKRNRKECFMQQRKTFCAKEDEPTFECKKIKECGDLGSKRRKKLCAQKLCSKGANSDEFECKRRECKRKSSNRKEKRQCIGNLCSEDNNGGEFLCQKIEDKETFRANKKRQRFLNPWKQMNSPIPRKLKKMCRDEPAERKADCILRELEEICKEIKDAEDEILPNACKCIGEENYEESLDGLKSCVKDYMLDYCQSEDNENGDTFECRKLSKCGNIGNRFDSKQCVKELCREDEFADTCPCQKRRRDRKKCFEELNDDDEDDEEEEETD